MSTHPPTHNCHLRSEMMVMAKLISANEQYLSSRILTKTYYFAGILMLFFLIPITLIMVQVPSATLMMIWALMSMCMLAVWVAYFVGSMRCDRLYITKEKAQKALEHLIEHQKMSDAA